MIVEIGGFRTGYNSIASSALNDLIRQFIQSDEELTATTNEAVQAVAKAFEMDQRELIHKWFERYGHDLVLLARELAREGAASHGC